MEHEDQQIEQIKKFLREYGIWIGAGVVIGLGSLFGWRAYSASQVENAQQRTAVYQQFAEQLDYTELAESYLPDLEGSSHAVVARLQLARQAVDSGELERAAELLESAVRDAKPELKGIVAIRLARIQLALEQHDAALTTLQQTLPDSFKAQVEELRGDIYLAQGRPLDARNAYQVAVDEGGAQLSPALQMKFENLAGDS